MCGIAGFLADPSRALALEQIAGRMGNAIAHRGPDDSGEWADHEAGVALAHRRLSIVDLSPAGHQPMISACGRLVLAFNGEIYNHAELRAALEAEGAAPPWRGHSDTEVLLAAIARWGVERTLIASVGMFALALWDRGERSLVLARDRLGEKPLYYGAARNTVLFASEPAALEAHPDFDGEIDRGAIALLLRHNYIPAPHSIYRHIRKLPPASWLVARHGRPLDEPRRYWQPPRGGRGGFEGSAEEAVERLDEALRRSLRGQMMADVPLGAFLSGGIDSSTVVALMQDLSPRPVMTFSIGFGEQAYDEAPHARAVARHLGTDHHELYVSEADMLGVVPRLAQIYSEPFADSSQIPTLLVSQMARRHVTVALSGDGGDELFSGYTRYDQLARLARALRLVPAPARRGLAGAIGSLPAERWDRLLRLVPRALLTGERRHLGDKLLKGADVLRQRDVGQIYRALVSLWHRPEQLVPGAHEPATAFATLGAPSGWDDPIRRAMDLDLVTYLPDDILAKVDRASMAVGLETRVPLLDHRIVELAADLPLDHLRRNGRTKWPLRQLLYRHLPETLVERPKMGFGVPLETWLRGPLRDWAEALIDERRLTSEGYLDPAPIRRAWREHLSGDRNLQYRLWTVLMLQSWLETRRPRATGQP